MDDRSATMTALMDVSAARRETDEVIEKLGDIAAKPSDLPDGLKPYLLPYVAQATNAVILEPSWANTLYAAVMATIATDPESEGMDALRAYLIQVASTAVAWVETLDERKQRG